MCKEIFVLTFLEAPRNKSRKCSGTQETLRGIFGQSLHRRQEYNKSYLENKEFFSCVDEDKVENRLV